LSIIGNEEQYSQYLDTIFPESKVREIVYHGTDVDFNEYKLGKGAYFGAGIYFTNNPKTANYFAKYSSKNIYILGSERDSERFKNFESSPKLCFGEE